MAMELASRRLHEPAAPVRGGIGAHMMRTSKPAHVGISRNDNATMQCQGSVLAGR
jgi:hypothetical protein